MLRLHISYRIISNPTSANNDAQKKRKLNRNIYYPMNIFPFSASASFYYFPVRGICLIDRVEARLS